MTSLLGYALEGRSSLGEVIPGGNPTGMSYLYIYLYIIIPHMEILDSGWSRAID